MAEKKHTQDGTPGSAPDDMILKAIQQVLLTARICNVTGIAENWRTANPVLMDGEWGLIAGAYPLQFKVGDGVTAWNSLGWGNVTNLAQLTADPTHRVVTDEQIEGWNNKGQAYFIDSTDTSAEMMAVIQRVVTEVKAGRNPIVFARLKNPDMFNDPYVTGGVTFLPIDEGDGQHVIGILSGMHVAKSSTQDFLDIGKVLITLRDEGGINFGIIANPTGLLTINSCINALNSTVTNRPLAAAAGKTLLEKIEAIKVPAYEISKVSTESGFASTYHLLKDGNKVGVSINIPLDQVLRSSSIKTVTTLNSPYAGAKVGDKYIEFLFQNNNTPQYLPVQDLVDVYTADNIYIQMSASNVISLRYDALKSKLQTDFSAVFDENGAGAAAADAAITAFAAKTFIIKGTIPGVTG